MTLRHSLRAAAAKAEAEAEAAAPAAADADVFYANCDAARAAGARSRG